MIKKSFSHPLSQDRGSVLFEGSGWPRDKILNQTDGGLMHVLTHGDIPGIWRDDSAIEEKAGALTTEQGTGIKLKKLVAR